MSSSTGASTCFGSSSEQAMRNCAPVNTSPSIRSFSSDSFFSGASSTNIGSAVCSTISAPGCAIAIISDSLP